MYIFLVGINLFLAKQIFLNPIPERSELPTSPTTPIQDDTFTHQPVRKYTTRFKVGRNVRMKAYFSWIDSIVFAYDSLIDRPLNEIVMVQANPWIISRLIQTDYYYQLRMGNQIANQRDMLVIQADDSLSIPEISTFDSIMARLNCINIDINIPEYALRILEDDVVLHEFPIRVGRKGHKFLPYLNREIHMQTMTGKGEIIQKWRDPIFTNFQTGKRYLYTRRDDDFTTRMPLIPAIIPKINGIQSNQVIHATTNPATIGKAYSHGCIGISEPSAWLIYYYTLIGTPIEFRYDLAIINEYGDSILLEDIYQLNDDFQ